jgi:DNA-binding NarL/FixJ family response regulator
MPIRIALGEDSLIVREGVRQLLAVDQEIEIVAAVADQLSLRQACDDEHPDVVITDIRMPPTHTDEGIRLAAELRETHPEIGVVILSQFSDPSYALSLLDHGSDGRAYLLKERVHNRAELMAAIRAVADGGSMIDPKVVEALVIARSRAERSPLNELTARELEVLAEIAQARGVPPCPPPARLERFVECNSQRSVAASTAGAAVIGLLSWLWLTAQLLLIAAEVNAVRADRLWPRSLGGALTDADHRALERAAAMAQSDPRQRIAVTFDDP